MDRNLLLFFLMNLYSFSFAVSENNYVFHFINESKTWEAAQNYCRKYYSDLATVKDLKDLKDLKELGEAAAGAGLGAWIGLNNLTGINRTWHWSLPGAEFNESEVKWNGSEPNDGGGPENCVIINQDSKLVDDDCETKRCFICYNNSTRSYTFSDTCANWTTAQHMCRENNTELISGLDQIDQISKRECRCHENQNLWWIGLFRDTWSWSDGSDSSFRNWSPDDEILNKHYHYDNKDCVKLGPQGTFIRDYCNQSSPFICYDELFILVKKNKTFEQALAHCREHHRDLAWFIDHKHLKRMAQARAKMADSEVVWVGLHYTCFLEAWLWVNGHYVNDEDENWKVPGETECGVAGAVEKGGNNMWVKRNLWEEHNFICVCEGSSCK